MGEAFGVKLAPVETAKKPKAKPKPKPKPRVRAETRPVDKRRRALSSIGGAVEVEARDPALGALLRAALDVEASEEAIRVHVHGFHSYPARLHPGTARALIEGASDPGDAVLDPFCGSGTVVVEARALGRRALGSDLNPLAVELTRLKSASVTAEFTRELLLTAEAVAEHARERKDKKLGPTERYGAEDRELFDTYVLLELDGLRNGIERVERREIRDALLLVHSSLLTKVSRRLGDSSRREGQKRIAAGFAIRFFVMRTKELAERLAEFSTLVPKGTPRAQVEIADARRLGFVRDGSVRLVVSSPPYPGVYDYYDHHRVRLRWLRRDRSARAFAEHELGSRRSARAAGARKDAAAEFERGFARCLGELRRVLRPKGRAFLVIADSVFAGRPLYAPEWLVPLAERAGLVTLGRAAQERPHFHLPTGTAFAAAPRREHLIAFERP